MWISEVSDGRDARATWRVCACLVGGSRSVIDDREDGIPLNAVLGASIPGLEILRLHPGF